ncbi:signal transduction histidine kinase [Lipingzhangella halophila]|uniref:histidine kinase n=1 Tax=Lipingzhangella halophila TaxID=1783352 RepID=A0A7W7RM67_9ACTN|nr:ATP-binding protein [Lipingzhangella halophila]MBB4934536.1 signal transduction histidine kinase [Lipingzhangella halophila]
MPEHPPPSAGEHPDARHRRHPAQDAGTASGLRGLHLWISVVPAAMVMLLAVAAVVILLAVTPSVLTTRIVLAMAAGGAVLVLAGAVYAATYATGRIEERLEALCSLSARGNSELQHLVEKVRNGEDAVPRSVDALPAETTDAFVLLEYDLLRSQSAAQNTVLQVANMKPVAGSEQQVEVFVNVARRMQSLVHREISLLDELEAKVEDPDLLKGLFTIDHLATQMRRQSESLAVLGGAASGRRWSRPVNLYEVLRSAVAEVESYPRVKVVPPSAGAVHGAAVVDVIHLVAELIENAAKFSPPHAHVVVRAEEVAAGVAVEVEDRGLGMAPADQRRMNGLLADPGQVNIGELLRDGRIGLYVVAALARKHGARVQLQTNVYGGTQAVAVLPRSLISPQGQDTGTQAQPEPAPAPGVPETPQRAAAPSPYAEPPPTASGGGSGSGPVPQDTGAQVRPEPTPASGTSRPPQWPTPAASHAEPPPTAPGGGSGSGPVPQDTGAQVRPEPAPASGTSRPPQWPTPAASHAEPPPTAPGGGNGSGPVPQDTGAQVRPEPAPASGTSRPPQWPTPAASHAEPPPAAPGGGNGSGPAPQGTGEQRAGSEFISRRPASTSLAASTAHSAPPGNEHRPPLPQRRAQTHLAPQLRESPEPRDDEPGTEHSPGLMAAFQGGFSQAEEEDRNRPGDRTD